MTEAVSPLFISEYERTTFYRGISHKGHYPELFYRSDLRSNPFPGPGKGRFPVVRSKCARPVHNTSLNVCWDTVAPKIVILLKDRNIRYSAIDPVRFFDYGPLGEEQKGCLGPVTIWIALHPGTTTVEAAHDASLDILELLRSSGVEGAVVELREGAPERLSGPALMPVVNDGNPTQYARRFFTAALGMPIALATKQNDDGLREGSVAFFFHENRDENGDPVDTVLGVSSCHVLSKDVTVDYQFGGNGPWGGQSVRVNGFRSFQRALDEIKDCISTHTFAADNFAKDIIELAAKLKNENPKEAEQSAKRLVSIQSKLAKEKEDIDTLEKLYNEALSHGDLEGRSIGYVHWAPNISVDVQGHKYTKDIGTFVADPMKFKAQFKGNIVSLAQYAREKLYMFFYSKDGTPTFDDPLDGQLRINGWVTREQLANPDCYERNGEPSLTVMKDGNTTDLTVGRYAGLESYLCNSCGVESIELAIYNYGKLSRPVLVFLYDKLSYPFSAKGDSGSLIFDGQGRMVGILHSGMLKSGTSYVTYATPAWWVIEQLKKRYPHAEFDRTSF